MSGVQDHLIEALARLAAVPVLLVGSDFDGVIAPIAPTPEEARADERVVRALEALSELRSTHVTVISGRDRSTLREQLPSLAKAATLVGAHGRSLGAEGWLSDERRQVLDRIENVLREVSEKLPASLVERKDTSCALHYRLSNPDRVGPALRRARERVGEFRDVHELEGHKVLEFGVLKADKGSAFAQVRFRAGATGALFIGDDVTDESVFDRFAEERADAAGPVVGVCVGVRVGPGETAAECRVPDQAHVAVVLEELLALRRAAIQADDSRRTPIEHHALLSDQRTIALVDPRGRVVWACLPRIDAPAMFAAMIDGEESGSFDVGPDEPTAPPQQSYQGDSFVLRTSWDGGRLVTTDYLDCSGGKAFQRAGRTDLIRVVEGRGRVRLRFSPRLDFGRSRTRLALRDGGVEIEGWLDPVVLVSPGVRWTITEDGGHQFATATVDLDGETPLFLELRYGSASVRPAALAEHVRRDATVGFWTGWSQTLHIPRRAPDLVRRSALVLKALCHGPTGAIAAAGTTSLPEQLGGVRNWDYRYCWPRDAALSASALVRLGNTGVGLRLLDWLSEVVAGCSSPDRLRPIYDVSGRELGPEGEVGEMRGFGRSRPVRVGNAAANQVQLDVFGPIVELVALLAQQGAPITPQCWRLVEAMVAAVASRWREPDHGIWEIRDTPRHHVHSKVMCWLAVDRALVICDAVMGRTRSDWESLRDEIGADVTANGFCPDMGRRGGYGAWYGCADADAASLWIGLGGLLPPDDPRFLGTIEAVEKHLTTPRGVFRYLCDDGLPGQEGVFHLCSSWLIEALCLEGRHAEAESLFEQLCDAAGPLGLLSEEIDPQHAIALGNYPQAYSHLGLINAAIRLSASR